MEVKKRKKTLSFEEALKKLEIIVQSLEQGDIPLEQLVEAYQEGLTYQKICQSHLDRAHLVLENITEPGSKQILSVNDDEAVLE